MSKKAFLAVDTFVSGRAVTRFAAEAIGATFQIGGTLDINHALLCAALSLNITEAVILAVSITCACWPLDAKICWVANTSPQASTIDAFILAIAVDAPSTHEAIKGATTKFGLFASPIDAAHAAWTISRL